MDDIQTVKLSDIFQEVKGEIYPSDMEDQEFDSLAVKRIFAECIIRGIKRLEVTREDFLVIFNYFDFRVDGDYDFYTAYGVKIRILDKDNK